MLPSLRKFLGLTDGPDDPGPTLAVLRVEAENGDAAAQNDLGWAYLTGKGAPRDERRAFEWFSRAAEQGDPHAQANLGRMIADGFGAKADFRRAAYWYRRAATQGQPVGQFQLGLLYLLVFLGVLSETLVGVPIDPVESYLWLALAAPKLTGNPKVIAEVQADNLVARMSPAERRRARSLVAEFKPNREMAPRAPRRTSCRVPIGPG
jgi:Sel1 repeat